MMSRPLAPLLRPPGPALSPARLFRRSQFRHPAARPLHGASPSLVLSQSIDSALHTTHTFLSALHTTTALPWAVTLPLAALLVRLSITLPLMLYTRRVQQRQVALQPVLQGQQASIRRRVLREAGALGPAECERRAQAAVRRARRGLYGRWECGWWKNWLPLGQLPVFLVVIETLRRMCGAHAGLLGLLALAPAAAGDGGAGGAVEMEPEAALAAPAAPGAAVVPVEQALAAEGALWFPDLLVPDPLLVLPFALSGALFANIALAAPRRTGHEPLPFQRRLTNALKIVALAVGPATLAVPSAMLLYWTASAALGLAQNLLLDRLMPLRPPVRACRTRTAPTLLVYGTK